jgi:hypothetical protein
MVHFREGGIDVNTEKTKYTVVSRHQNAGQNHNLPITNKCFEKYGKYQIFGNDSNK